MHTYTPDIQGQDQSHIYTMLRLHKSHRYINTVEGTYIPNAHTHTHTNYDKYIDTCSTDTQGQRYTGYTRRRSLRYLTFRSFRSMGTAAMQQIWLYALGHCVGFGYALWATARNEAIL
jgi:hypothetical protein